MKNKYPDQALFGNDSQSLVSMENAPAWAVDFLACCSDEELKSQPLDIRLAVAGVVTRTWEKSADSLNNFIRTMGVLELPVEYQQLQNRMLENLRGFFAKTDFLIQMENAWPDKGQNLTEDMLVNGDCIRRSEDFGQKFLQNVVPLLQQLANVQAKTYGIDPPALCIRPAGQMGNVGYVRETSEVAQTADSIVFENPASAIMFCVHETAHHLQEQFCKSLKEDRLEKGSWQYDVGRIMTLFERYEGRIVMPPEFQGTDMMAQARAAYRAAPHEADAYKAGNEAEALYLQVKAEKTMDRRYLPISPQVRNP